MIYSDWFPDAAFGRDEFSSEMLARHGTRYRMGSMSRLSVDQGVSVCLHRQPGMQDFTHQEREVFALVLPDLAGAAHDGLLSVRVADLRSGRVNAGVLAFNESGALRHVDSRALAPLEQVAATGKDLVQELGPDLGRVSADPAAALVQRCVPVPVGFVRASVSRVPSGVVAVVDLLVAGSPAHFELVSHSWRLTAAERDVARLVAAGRSNKEIACKRKSSLETVKAQLKAIP